MGHYQTRGEGRNIEQRFRDDDNRERGNEGRRREQNWQERGDERSMSQGEYGGDPWQRSFRSDEGRFGGSEYGERSRQGFEGQGQGRFGQPMEPSFGNRYGGSFPSQPYGPSGYGYEGRGEEFGGPQFGGSQGMSSQLGSGYYGPGSSQNVGNRFGGNDWRRQEQAQQRGFQGSNIPSGFQQGEEGIHERGFRGKGPKGYLRSDERIKEEVCDVLTDHSLIDATEIEVQVRNGEVILTGVVKSREEKRLAEDIIDDLSGVKEINNQLRVNREAKAGNGHEQKTQTQKAMQSGQPSR